LVGIPVEVVPVVGSGLVVVVRFRVGLEGRLVGFGVLDPG
jgi:hypothetical protein